MERFEIEWKGPYSVNRAPTLKAAENFAVYAIFEKKGSSSKLRYIGRTYWQDFGKRLTQYKRDWLDRVGGQQVVHFGTVKLSIGQRISFQRVRDIEELLIHAHVPPNNTVSKKGYIGRDLLIVSTGKVGTLDKLVTNDEQLLMLIRKFLPRS